MTLPLFKRSALDNVFAALRKDLLRENGPSISTMRNYRFAIVQYRPRNEFEVRKQVQTLAEDLKRSGWLLLSLDLQKLFIQRVRAQGEEWVDRVMEMERRTSERDPSRGLNYLKGKLAPLIEGPSGLAADCARLIRQHLDLHPETTDRTLALIGRAGALYPFFRSSALLRHLDGHTAQVPVVLLYPGSKRGDTGLSFMDKVVPDSDYRPRIYGEDDYAGS